MKKTSDAPQEWAKVKRQYALTDAHIQMARELGMNRKRLTGTAGTVPGLTQATLARRIENLYVRRYKRTTPDLVVPLRQLLHDARARERAEAREGRRRKRQAEIDHVEAARVSMLTLRRLYGGQGVDDDV